MTVKRKKKQLEAMLSSGYIYICDPTTLRHTIDPAAIGGLSDESAIDPFLKTNPFANWDALLAEASTKEIANPKLQAHQLPCMPFQDSGPGKGILIPTNALNGKLEVKIKKDKETGRVVQVTIKVCE